MIRAAPSPHTSTHLAELAGRDEHATVSLYAVQRTDKSLDVRTADSGGGVSLCLDVDAVETERVLPDEAVESFVAGAAEVLCRSSRTGVAHCGQHLQDKVLEEVVVLLEDTIQEVVCDGRLFSSTAAWIVSRGVLESLKAVGRIGGTTRNPAA